MRLLREKFQGLVIRSVVIISIIIYFLGGGTIVLIVVVSVGIGGCGSWLSCAYNVCVSP